MLSKEQQEERLELYNKGLNDKKMADILGLVPVSICFWRNKHNLPPVRGIQKRVLPKRTYKTTAKERELVRSFVIAYMKQKGY